jgi:hypothetical protein
MFENATREDEDCFAERLSGVSKQVERLRNAAPMAEVR